MASESVAGSPTVSEVATETDLLTSQSVATFGQGVAQLAITAGFPVPEVELTGGRIWSRHAIERWAVEHQEGRAGGADEAIAPEGFYLDLVIDLAAQEAQIARTSWVGVEHVVVAMLRPESSPGLARAALSSFGMTLETARTSLVEQFGGDHAGAISVTPRLTAITERAKLKAAELSDPDATSHHLLLAVLDVTPHANGLLAGVDPDWLRQRIVALSDAPSTDPAPNADWIARRARANAWTHATGVKRWTDLRLRSDGVDQRDRTPWGSVLIGGRRIPGRPLQYTIDADGVPVISGDGRPISTRVTDEWFLALDEAGEMVQEPFDLPDDVQLEWPPGFTFPSA